MTIGKLIDALKIESKAQEMRFSIGNGVSLKELKAQGYVLQPIRITRKSYGFADYPEFEFRLPYPADSSQFRNGCSIHFMTNDEKAISGTLLYLEANRGEVRLYAPDFPDWIEEKYLAIQLLADQRTNEIQQKALKFVQEHKKYASLFQQLHQPANSSSKETPFLKLIFQNQQLNKSQQKAIIACFSSDEVEVIHGPPGTGKTTTLVELIFQFIHAGKRILVSAPSNTAVDNIGLKLAQLNLDFLRVGNNVKVHDELIPYTISGKIEGSNLKQTIKKMRIQSEQLRKMANQYKRHFGKSERDQRRLLLQEVKSIRAEIKAIQTHFEEVAVSNTQVVLGTPIGIYDANFKVEEFDVLIMDEAGQCLEPLAWTIIPFAKKIILAGDPYQLPPTVISEEATAAGFSVSLLEALIQNQFSVHLLDVQYRMPPVIAEFSNRYFYEGRLKSNQVADSNRNKLLFFDTAGADYFEQEEADSASLINQEELHFIRRLLNANQFDIPSQDLVFITPYNGQLQQAKELLSNLEIKRFSTIDSFQGQEADVVLLSLVRSNKNQQIGFLKDYRRMNVALTRAKKQLILIGDSATIGFDPFYQKLLDYVEEVQAYHSVFELVDCD